MEDKTKMVDKTTGITDQDGAYLAELLLKKGHFAQDIGMPDGTIRKMMDVPQIRNLGWTPGISLFSDIEQ